MNLTHPKMLVVAEDVELGKPDPRCYLLGRKRLGLRSLSVKGVVDGRILLEIRDAYQ